MYPYGIPVPYYPGAHPRSLPDPDPFIPPIPEQRKVLAKRAGATHISADGSLIYHKRLGGVYEAEWHGTGYDSWWYYGEAMPGGVVEV